MCVCVCDISANSLWGIGLQPHHICDAAVVLTATGYLWSGVVSVILTGFEFRVCFFFSLTDLPTNKTKNPSLP